MTRRELLLRCCSPAVSRGSMVCWLSSRTINMKSRSGMSTMKREARRTDAPASILPDAHEHPFFRPYGLLAKAALRPHFGHCSHIRSFPKPAIRTRVTEVTFHTGGVASSILAAPIIFQQLSLGYGSPLRIGGVERGMPSYSQLAASSLLSARAGCAYLGNV